MWEDEFIQSPFPEIFHMARQELDKCCAAGKRDEAQIIYERLLEQIRSPKLWRIGSDDRVLVAFGGAAVSLVLAYGKAGETDKAEKIIQDMEGMRDSAGQPVVDIRMLNLMAKMRK